MVPNPIGPNDRDGATRAYLQAIGFGTLNTAGSSGVTFSTFGPNEAEFLEPRLKMLPRRSASFGIAAFLLLRQRAEKDLPFDRLAF